MHYRVQKPFSLGLTMTTFMGALQQWITLLWQAVHSMQSSHKDVLTFSCLNEHRQVLPLADELTVYCFNLSGVGAEHLDTKIANSLLSGGLVVISERCIVSKKYRTESPCWIKLSFTLETTVSWRRNRSSLECEDHGEAGRGLKAPFTLEPGHSLEPRTQGQPKGRAFGTWEDPPSPQEGGVGYVYYVDI